MKGEGFLKKLPLIFGGILVIIAVYVFVDKLYYPPIPIKGVSQKEAINSLNESDSNAAQIAVEGDTVWFITKTENMGTLVADENIKQLVIAKGWEFKEKDGAGLFFEKDGKRLIATTQMWTKKYVIVKMPKF